MIAKITTSHSLLATSLVCVASLLSSCTTNLEPPPPPPGYSSSSAGELSSSSYIAEISSSSTGAVVSSSSTGSSSSAVPSSSSVNVPSSSSVAISSSSSSSSAGLCDGFADGTKREHHGWNKAQFCDKRDGQKYVYVFIGDQWNRQVWMAENLNYIPASGNSWCYGNKDDNCKTYGRLYDWNTAKTVCPSGWHLPTKEQWEVLISQSGGEGKHLKATSGWNENNGVSGNGTDGYGFSALPGGYYTGSTFNDAGRYGRWWSSSEYDADNAYSYGMNYDNDYATWDFKAKSYGRSVRCLRDE